MRTPRKREVQRAPTCGARDVTQVGPRLGTWRCLCGLLNQRVFGNDIQPGYAMAGLLHCTRCSRNYRAAWIVAPIAAASPADGRAVIGGGF